MNRQILLLLLLALVSVQCAQSSEFPVKDSPIPAGCEIVMAPNTKITATTPVGTIQIVSGSGLMRTYTWEGETRSVEMWARTKRWMGSKGMYFPGPGEHWNPVNGITRGVLEEGVQNFRSTSSALKWIENHSCRQNVIYRNDGLLVCWDKDSHRKQLNVDLLQILINNKKPKELRGADDSKIFVEKVHSTLNADGKGAPTVPTQGGYGEGRGAGYPAGDYLDGKGKPLRY